MKSAALKCQSCGMLLDDPSKHACRDVEIPFCIRCVTPHGILGAKEQVVEQLHRFYVESLGLSEDEATRKANEKIRALFP